MERVSLQFGSLRGAMGKQVWAKERDHLSLAVQIRVRTHMQRITLVNVRSVINEALKTSAKWRG